MHIRNEKGNRAVLDDQGRFVLSVSDHVDRYLVVVIDDTGAALDSWVDQAPPDLAMIRQVYPTAVRVVVDAALAAAV